MKQEIDKKIMFVIMIVAIILLPVYKIITNKNSQIDKRINETKREQFSMYIEDGEGYKEYKDSDKFPEGYKLNINNSKCEDIEGNKVDTSKVLSSKGNSITVRSNKTVYCTLYFDYAEEGEKENPYKIQYIEDLVDLQVSVNNGETYAGKYFELERDLDFQKNDSYQDYRTTQYGDINGTGGDQELKTELTTGTGWKPIGNTETNSFQGILDGKNHTLSNIYINNNTASASMGLFGVLKNADVNNLKINGTMESSVSANMGSIVGRAYGTNTFENIESNTNVTGIPGSGSIGGIIGSISDTTNGNDTLIHLINRGKITDGNSTAGIIAWVQGTHAVMEDCHNYGEISQTGTSARSGGLIGATTISYVTTLEISNSSNSGNVSGSKIAGGVIGVSGSPFSTITKSFNTGGVTGNSYVGGIAGSSFGGLLIIDRVYNSGEIRSNSLTDSSRSSGILGVTQRGSSYETFVINSYNTGDVIHMSSSTGYFSGISNNENTAKTYIINCYNNGTINGGRGSYSSGIGSVTMSTYSYNMGIGNTYNVGAVEGSYNMLHPLGVYYEDVYDNFIYPDVGQDFVDELNYNINKIDLNSLDSNLSGYTLCPWILGNDNYPTLDC